MFTMIERAEEEGDGLPVGFMTILKAGPKLYHYEQLQALCAKHISDVAKDESQIEAAPVTKIDSVSVQYLSAHSMCKVCHVNLSNVVFANCFHISSCSVCSASLTKCPICRANITARKLVYF